MVRIDIDVDLQGWRPSQNQTDKHGQLIEDRIYNQVDMDRTLVLEKRTELVAKKITEFLTASDLPKPLSFVMTLTTPSVCVKP